MKNRKIIGEFSPMHPGTEVVRDKMDVEKGPFDPHMKTYKTMTYKEKVDERAEQLALLKSGQTCGYMTPGQ